MANYYDLFGDPTAVINPRVAIHAIDDSDGLPLRTLTVTMSPTEGRMELPRGATGPTGPPGAPAAAWILMGEKANAADITAIAYGVSDKGKAWRNIETNDLHYWNGTGWIILTDAVGLQGATGHFGYIDTVNVTQVAPTAPPNGWVTGDPGLQQLNLEIPGIPGPVGPTGPSAAIATAADVNPAMDPNPGDSLRFGSDGKWTAEASAITRSYSMPEGAFVNTKSDARTILAQLPLEPLPYATTIEVGGCIRAVNSLLSTTGVEVRIGNSDTGQIAGRALVSPGMGEKYCPIQEVWSTSTDPNVQQHPMSPVGVIPAMHTGTAGTLYVVGYRAAGYGDWEVKGEGAQLTVKRRPLAV